ncbi:MAG TPA: thioredoxin-like domain-containing protein [Puia sp.]|nr:thioredoxin-like domain-containing protein [Puia sp.]
MRLGKMRLLLVFIFISATAAAQEGYNIKLTLKPYTNSLVYLAYYYGKVKAIADSAILDANSTTTFKGKDKLPGGIYFIVSPKKEILFEVLIDKQQHFSITADTVNLSQNLTFTGSSDNNLFFTYTRTMAKYGESIGNLQREYAQAKNKADSLGVREKIVNTNQEVQNYRNDLAAKNPTSLLATLFAAMKEPVVPPASQQPGGKYDTMFAYHYYKAHYWDGVSFTDDRLVRTPLFEPKLDKYFKDLVSPIPDSINKEVDWMLLYSRTAKEMYKFLMVHFVQKYVNPEYMGQDAVFVHIFEKFINTGDADFFTEKYRKLLNDRAYSLMANLIGQPAANLDMVDTSGKSKPLYGVDAKFIVLCFWDPTCSHCKEEVPKLDSMYQAKWKAEGVKMYGVMVDGGQDKWRQFIREHNLKDWIHVYQTKDKAEADEAANRPSYKQLFDVYQTPTMFLLDKDKHIIAKKLTYQQFDEVITLKLKNGK